MFNTLKYIDPTFNIIILQQKIIDIFAILPVYIEWYMASLTNLYKDIQQSKVYITFNIEPIN